MKTKTEINTIDLTLEQSKIWQDKGEIVFIEPMELPVPLSK